MGGRIHIRGRALLHQVSSRVKQTQQRTYQHIQQEFTNISSSSLCLALALGLRFTHTHMPLDRAVGGFS